MNEVTIKNGNTIIQLGENNISIEAAEINLESDKHYQKSLLMDGLSKHRLNQHVE